MEKVTQTEPLYILGYTSNLGRVKKEVLKWAKSAEKVPRKCREQGKIPYIYVSIICEYCLIAKMVSKEETPRYLEGFFLGGRPVSNRRPLEPQSSALTN